MSYLYLLLAIVSEVAGSLMLRKSHGFEHLGLGMTSLVLFIISLALLSFAMKTIPISISYPLWAGLGTIGALIGGRFLFAEQLTLLQIVGSIFILFGAVLVRSFGAK
jgi:multidrug transporter EmrE-like cation transporter